MPPRGTKRVGLFSTRTPHRPNPIGLSTARVEKVDVKKGILHLSGIDLLHGTPILDVKPYIPHWDALPEQPDAIPKWIIDAVDDDKPRVATFSEGAASKLKCIVEEGRLQFYDEIGQVEKAILEVLRQDIRSPHKKNVAKEERKSVDEHSVDFDNLRIIFLISEGGSAVTVTEVELHSNFAKFCPTIGN